MAGPYLGDRLTLQLQRHAAPGKFRNLHRVLPFCFLNLSHVFLSETMKYREFVKQCQTLHSTNTCTKTYVGARDICHRATPPWSKMPPGQITPEDVAPRSFYSRVCCLRGELALQVAVPHGVDCPHTDCM